MKFSLDWLGDFVDVAAAGGPDGLRRLLDQAGIPIESIAAAGEDTIVDAEITPNRPDAMGHRGLAREIAAMAGQPLFDASARYAEPATESESTEQLASIVIQVPRLCRRFGARVVRGVSNAPAGELVRRRLAAIGSKSISAAVDATNYVLWDTGQPLHAFDYDKLAGSLLIVRKAARGEKLVTLDGVERTLDPSDVVVADGDAGGLARRDHGRARDGRDAGDEERAARGRLVGPRDGSQDRATPRHAHGRLASLRAGRGPRRHPRGARARGAAPRRGGRRDRRAGAPRRARGEPARPQDGPPSRAPAHALGRRPAQPRVCGAGPGPPRLPDGTPRQAPRRLDSPVSRRRAPRGRPRRRGAARLRLRPAALAPSAVLGARRLQGAPAPGRGTAGGRRRVVGPLRDGQLSRSWTGTRTSRPGATGCA